VSTFLQYAVQGLQIGCVFALLAVGLTLNYKTSGVFNLAFAAQAYASAALFYVLRRDHDWPLLPAALMAIVLFGAALAWVLDRFLYRHQRTATPLAKLVTSLGLLVAIPQIVQLFIGYGNREDPPPLAPYKDSIDFLWHITSDIVLDANQIATIVATGLIVIGLVLLFRRGGLGLRMRAVVESPRLLQLQGVDAERVALSSWVLSSLLASLAGVLIAPLFSQLDSPDFFTLLAAALAACVIGNLTSIPGAFLGGLGLGVLQAELAGYLPTNSVLSTGLRPSLPFVVMFVLLIGRRSLRKRQPAIDPLSGVDPPPAPPSASVRPDWMTLGTRIFGVTVVVVGLFLALFVLDAFWDSLVISGVCLSVILLSIVITTGIGGTISLAPGAFAAIGAFGTAQLVQHNWSVLPAMVVGALIAAAVGAVLGFPVIRLPGIYAALATLAFALMFEGLLVPLTWVSGGDGNIPLPVPRPLMFGIDFSSDHAFLLLATALLAILGLATIAIRQGTTGRFLDAVRGSGDAAAAIGINASRQRLIVFIVGAAVAGFGGGLLASDTGQANYAANFTFVFALVWVVLVITAGSRLVQAAATSGITFFILPELLTRLFTWMHGFISFVNPSWATGVAFILFGFGAFTYAKHPEGIIEAQTTASVARTVAFVDRLRGRTPRSTDEEAGGAPGSDSDTGPPPGLASPTEART
jgi:branched-subunit amino acid ABC-type transport system permease component